MVIESAKKDHSGIIEEIQLLRSNTLDMFIMMKDLVLKYYPDIDVPNKNILIHSLIQMGETVQDIVCGTIQTTKKAVCEDEIDTPENIREIVCKNINTLTDLACDNIKDSIRMIDNLTSIHMSDKIVDTLRTT